jgi:hypothetical protein
VKKNRGAAYNVITLDYETSSDGQALKNFDDDKNNRAMVRSKNLDLRANSQYNILNGIQNSFNLLR